MVVEVSLTRWYRLESHRRDIFVWMDIFYLLNWVAIIWVYMEKIIKSYVHARLCFWLNVNYVSIIYCLKKMIDTHIQTPTKVSTLDSGSKMNKIWGVGDTESMCFVFFFKMFFFSLKCFINLIIVCLGGVFSVSSCMGLVELHRSTVWCFHQVWKVSVIISSSIFSAWSLSPHLQGLQLHIC